MSLPTTRRPSKPAERPPGLRLLFALMVAAGLAVPLLLVYALVGGRDHQADEARASIVQGWGGRQVMTGPYLAIPYQHDETRTTTVDGQSVTRTEKVWDELILWPQSMTLDTSLDPQSRKRAIYSATVYQALAAGEARFTLPSDLAAQGVDPKALDLSRVELRLGLSDPGGFFGDPPRLTLDGRPAALQPGHGPKATGGGGVFGLADAETLKDRPVTVAFDYHFRGDTALALIPHAADTVWRVRSSWPDPSFKGRFLPETHKVGAGGFEARYRMGNLAIGRPLIGDDQAQAFILANDPAPAQPAVGDNAPPPSAEVDLIQPVDIYSQVDRATKYGFLFIGFTFLVFLLFDLVGGTRVAPAEYLLVGAALVLFFVMLLAFAEVVGFLAAYLMASGAIVVLITAYSAAVLGSRRRAGFVAALLTVLYAAPYLLINLEAYALLVGAVMLFAALAGVMWATRNIDWSGKMEAASVMTA
jgi:inner membrane protein